MIYRVKYASMFTTYITGIVGGWKHHFTVAQSEEMDRLIAEHFKGNIFETLSNVN